MRTIIAILLILAGTNVSAQEGPKAKKSRGHFTIGKETTYFVGPVDKEGYIDYAAAVNKRLGEGATPQNNAVVLLWRAHGPHPEGGRSMPAEFFRLMGINEPPQGGPDDYFVDLFRYLKNHGKDKMATNDIYQLMEDLSQRPWKAKDHLDAAQWLKAIEKPLALVVEASGRSHYFSPLIPSKLEELGLVRGGLLPQGSAGLVSALLPGVQKCRSFAQALSTRAMLRLGDGDSDGAWQDLLACHRLARLVSKGSTLIESLVGIAVDGMASKADIVFLERSKLDAKRIKTCLDDLRKLPPLSSIADRVDLTERSSFLDSAMLVDRHGPVYLDLVAGVSGGRVAGPASPILERLLVDIDWNPALRNGNRWYDRMAAAMRQKDFGARKDALRKLEMDLRAQKAKFLDVDRLSGTLKTYVVLAGVNKAGAEVAFHAAPPRSQASAMALETLGDRAARSLFPRLDFVSRIGLDVLQTQTAAERGKLAGELLISLFLPAVSRVQEATDRAQQIQSNLHVAFALAQYHREQGRYPDKLDALAPRYLAQVPQDLFSGKALIYRPTEKGYLLYSVGVNGKDDGGRGLDDDPRGDDLVIRVPLPERRRK